MGFIPSGGCLMKSDRKRFIMTGKQFFKIIKNKNLSIPEVAKELCVTERAVYLWLKEERKIPLSIEKLFCLIYDIEFKMNNIQKIDDTFLPPLLFDIDHQ